MNTFYDSQVQQHVGEPPSRARRLQRGALAASRDRSAPPSRHLLTRGVFAIPVLPGGRPDVRHTSEGITVGIGASGITFETASITNRATSKWLVGVERDDGQLGFLAVKARNVTLDGIGMRIEGSFLSGADDPLRADNLEPKFDPHTFQFRPRMSAEALQQWQSLGVVRQELFDCVIVCPRCRSLPTIRRGCRACGSIEVRQDRFIHHFACAHVDLVSEFEREDEIACPKCRGRQLVVGADFEFLSGPYSCHDCGWSDKDLENIARCMACGFEFPEDHAVEEEVIGYHVERLEPLDLVAAH